MQRGYETGQNTAKSQNKRIEGNNICKNKAILFIENTTAEPPPEKMLGCMRGTYVAE